MTQAIRFTQQQGMSLISMLIGLMISILCILSSLTLYKNLVHVAADSKVATSYDSQLASAMYTIQMELQSAGYKIADAGASHLVKDDDGHTIAFYWRYYDGANYQCRGFKEVDNAASDPAFRLLKLVKANCTATSVLDSLAWNDHAILAQWPLVEKLVTYKNGDSLLDITAPAKVECSPYGALAPQKHWSVTITAPTSAMINGAGGNANVFTFCLPNTYWT